MMTSDEGRRHEAWWRLKQHLGVLPKEPHVIPMPPVCPTMGRRPVIIGIDLAEDDSGGFTPTSEILK